MVLKRRTLMVSEARKTLSRLVKEVERDRSLIVNVSQRSHEGACIVNSHWLDELLQEHEWLKKLRPKKIIKLGGVARWARGVDVKEEITKARKKVAQTLEKRRAEF